MPRHGHHPNAAHGPTPPTSLAGADRPALSTRSTELIASRALMGVGAAGIMSIITNIFPDDEPPKAIAIWAAVAGLGVAVGPISGGWLIEHVDWSAIFLVNLPAVAVCLIGAALLVPESRDPDSPRLDVVGAGLMRLAGTSTSDMADAVGLRTSALRARLSAIVAVLGGPPEPLPGGPLRAAA